MYWDDMNRFTTLQDVMYADDLAVVESTTANILCRPCSLWCARSGEWQLV